MHAPSDWHDTHIHHVLLIVDKMLQHFVSGQRILSQIVRLNSCRRPIPRGDARDQKRLRNFTARACRTQRLTLHQAKVLLLYQSACKLCLQKIRCNRIWPTMRNNQNSWGREIQPGDRCKVCQIRIYWLDTIPQLLQDPFAAAIWCLGDSQDSRSPGQNFQITSCLLQDLGDMETSKTSPAHILQLPPPESCAEQPCRSSWTQSLHRFRGWSHMHSVGDQPLLQHSFTDLICSERLQRFSCVSWIILDQFLILLTYWLWYVMRVYVFSYDATQLIWYPANLMPRFLLWEYENAGKNWNNQPVACSEACHFSAFTRTRFRLSKQCVEAMPTISGWTSQNTLSATCHAAAFSWSDGSKEQHRISQLDSIRILSSDIDPKNCKFLTESHLPTQP